MKPLLPALIWALVILCVSTSPSVQMSVKIVSADKLGHCFAYGMLSWLTLKGLHKMNKLNVGVIALVVMGATVYGVVLEFIQWAFFPNRFFEVWDMIANFVGVLLGLSIFNFFSLKNSQNGF